MDNNVFVLLILMLAINVIVLICGLILNSLVVLCWIKSSHLRKKACHFTICLLSCIDLLTVATNNPVLITELAVWIGEKESLLQVRYVARYINIFISLSFLTLLLVSIERYLAIFQPIFHRKKVNKTFLIKLHFFLLFLSTIIFLLYRTKHAMISAIVFTLLFILPFLLINTKLHNISKKYRGNNSIRPESNRQLSRKGKFSLISTSTCLLLVACVLICCIPLPMGIIFWVLQKETALDLTYLLSKTFWCINSTCNCLVIFWRNKNIRSEAIKILKQLSNA